MNSLYEQMMSRGNSFEDDVPGRMKIEMETEMDTKMNPKIKTELKIYEEECRRGIPEEEH